MNSTNVHSENNNSKSEMVMLATQIKGKEKENDFELIAQSNARAGVISYIQSQLGPELKVEEATLTQEGKLITKNGTITMKSKDAYKKVLKNQTKRKEMQGKISLKNSTKANTTNTDIGR